MHLNRHVQEEITGPRFVPRGIIHGVNDNALLESFEGEKHDKILWERAHVDVMPYPKV